MARNERQDDDERGGVTTLTWPGVRPRPVAGARPSAAPRPGTRLRPGAVPATPATPAAPAPAVGVPGIPNARTAPAPGAVRPGPAAVAPSGSRRLPFMLLLCGLLGGALVCALVISTTLAEGSFQISKLQDSTITQARQLQSLQEQVAQSQSAATIEARAVQLGMRPLGELRFIDLKTGKVSTDGTNWTGLVPPGYTP
jgi:hypothetical protein